MGITVAVILARAGSKGIPGKNLLELEGKPLLAWSIEQAKSCEHIDSVWVSSDGDDILSVANRLGVNAIKRPTNLSGDTATSESGWLHAIEVIESQGYEIDRVVGIQGTSPIREASDMDEAIVLFEERAYDSLFSACEIRDYNVWQLNEQGDLESVNYDYRNRQRRQSITPRYLENGSFYIFKPNILRTHNNRMGGQKGVYIMELYKSFQIDEPEDVRWCIAMT